MIENLNETITDVLKPGEFDLDLVNLRRLMLVLTQSLYRDSKNLAHRAEYLKRYRYDSNPILSRVAIELEFSKPFSADDTMPRITVGVNGAQLNQIVSGHMADNYGKKVCTAKSEISIKHFSKFADESAILGSCTLDFFAGFSRVMAKRLNIRSIHMGGIMGPAMAKEYDKTNATYYVTTVGFALNYDYVWTETLETPILRKIDVNLMPKMSDPGTTL